MRRRACPDCRCAGQGWMTMAEMCPGRYRTESEAEAIAVCYCPCHEQEDTRVCEHPNCGDEEHPVTTMHRLQDGTWLCAQHAEEAR